MQNFDPGQLIGGTYKVIDILGEGGMGLVYRVEHIHLTKVFALKVLKTEHLSESVWKRFRVEGLAIARLDHINIVKIYDMAQTEDGLPYYTMDLLVGQSLADYIQDTNRLAVRHALPIFRQVCAGLAYAHERGIIHRDIKPGNIMLLANDQRDPGDLSAASEIERCGVKIVDFGIAKMLDDGGLTQGLTRPGEVFGSPLYMSPEQCLGLKLDARSDMYSVGVSLFQALTGRPPLLGKTAVETTFMHQSTPAPMLKDLAPDLNFLPDLERLVAKMLAKEPENRFASLADVAQELLRMERGESQNLLPKKSRAQQEEHFADDEIPAVNTGAKLFLVAGLMLLLSAGIAAFFLFAQKGPVVSRPAQQEDLSILGIDKMALKKDSETIVTPAEATLAKDFIATKQFFSEPLKPGDASIVFNFPKSFCIGELHAQTTREIKNRAEGQVIVSRNVNLVYQGNKYVCEQPALLRSFRPNELMGVYIHECHPRNPDLAKEVAKLSQLNQVDLSNDQLNNEDLKYLEKLKRLRTLTINYSDVTSQALAASSLLPQLYSLSIEGMTNISPLANQLAQARIRHIDLSTSPLTDKDFEALGQIASLKDLSFRRTGMKARNLKALSKLHLRELRLADNPLEPEAIEILKKFKTLERLQLPDDLGTPINVRALQKAIPGLQVEVKVSSITNDSPHL